jgi:hypothetical protein
MKIELEIRPKKAQIPVNYRKNGFVSFTFIPIFAIDNGKHD